ncbi:hypothetical protein DXG01_001267 [Tephrocybe rancida]|nr:hypothetical protein DXG01_001267 [Tephrocybe rancida]
MSMHQCPRCGYVAPEASSGSDSDTESNVSTDIDDIDLNNVFVDVSDVDNHNLQRGEHIVATGAFYFLSCNDSVLFFILDFQLLSTVVQVPDISSSTPICPISPMLALVVPAAASFTPAPTTPQPLAYSSIITGPVIRTSRSGIMYEVGHTPHPSELQDFSADNRVQGFYLVCVGQRVGVFLTW